MFHVLRSSSGLPIGQLNPLTLRHSVARVLGIPIPDISMLRVGAILFKTPTLTYESGSFPCVVLSGGSGGFGPPRSSKGTVYAFDFV